MTVAEIPGNVWSAPSEKAENRFGGALASQLDGILSNLPGPPLIENGIYNFTYTGSGGWDNSGIVDHDGEGPFDHGSGTGSNNGKQQISPLGQTIDGAPYVPPPPGVNKKGMDDDHRNNDGSPISVKMKIQSVCIKQ